MQHSLILILQQEGGGGFFLIIQFALIFGILYFLLIRPAQKRQKMAQLEREKMLSALKAGDKVVTSGGLYGTIVTVREKTVQLRIAQSISVEVLRSGIASLQEEANETEPSK